MTRTPILPSVRPGEIGNRWFGLAKSDLVGAGIKKGKVRLVAYIKDPPEKVEIKHGGVAVEMDFINISENIDVSLDGLTGATRDELGRLVVDYKDCG